ncbi:glutathione S-transferase, N-terminal domain [Luminiphilus syltensis NOR5-1B]|uniref:Glutathione S-transferase, N-terminal domain n=1 Tax=Luminiphilus syltensis NOR5-1B TaxID=565045 RepID=B8KUH2_9GAMM|nr:glutathione S-transferase N-terminal domain-containing protein [Luminiphilus syltensis]EED35221.1 glutathione S-transferase, N-terminal domain [Luminiphilus syltensis NOR5-1B]
MLKLINAGPSPFGRKVMVALHEKSIPFKVEWDIPWHKDTVVTVHNPLQQLPILIADDGETVFESSYILEWIDTRFPEPPLTPSDPEARLEMGRFRVLSVGIMDALVRTNFEVSRPLEHQSQEWVQRHIRKINGGLAELDREIQDRNFVVGNELTLGDIEVGCVLGQLDFIAENIPPLKEFFAEHVPWRSDCKYLSRYADRLCQRPSFVASAPFMVDIDFASVIA